MLTLLGIILGLLSVTFHELGHYEAMRRCGIKIKEVSLLGVPLPYVPSAMFKYKETLWGIHPFVIGAYVVAHDEEEWKERRVWDQLYISANGPLANIVYALVLVAIAVSVREIGAGELRSALIWFGGCTAMATLLWFGRRFVALLMPLMSFPILFLIAHGIMTVSPSDAVNGGAGGPVAVVASLTGAQSLPEACLLAAFLSINLALFNLVPLPPFDGGHMWSALLKRFGGNRIEKIYTYSMIPITLAIVVYVIGLDSMRIWKWFG